MSKTDAARRLSEIVDLALDLHGPQRSRFLDEACGDHRELRCEVDSLLFEESALNDGFLQTPAPQKIAESMSIRSKEGPADRTPMPERVGPYHPVRILGEGGMGTVYLAEQEHPIRRRVALKVIDAFGHRRRKRFAGECQALARLNHPNVASMYEAGLSEDGHPFVAMEWVEGDEIVAWCDARRLGLRERLELFQDVCAGVRHAHEKGILHRDIKPSNVLVTEVDGAPVAKVIDFGIARALGEPLLADTELTLDVLVGSPAYMCPELVDPKAGHEADTRSDVYSLGLLLHELLLGVLPFDHRGFTVPMFFRHIVSEDPLAPSVRFSKLGFEQRLKIASVRGLDELALARRLRGDLDAITLKALSRGREERYSSPADLAADLERSLKNKPIEARPASTLYALSRFLKRRFGAAVSTFLLLLTLSGGLVARTIEARRANQEAERARKALVETEEVSRFLVELFEVADPERNPGEPVDVRALLDRGAERLRGELSEQPLARARFLHTIAEIYTKMALFEPAEELLTEALLLRRTLLPADHPDLVRSLNQLGVLYRRQGRHTEAEPLLRQVLEVRRTADQRDEVEVGLALNNLANALWAQEKFAEAESLHRRALDVRERALGSKHDHVGETVNNLGVLLHSQGRYLEAEPFLRRALLIFESTLGQEHPRSAATLNNLALLETDLGRFAEAQTHARRALAFWQKAYGPNHPRCTTAKSNLAKALEKLGHAEEAGRLWREIAESR